LRQIKPHRTAQTDTQDQRDRIITLTLDIDGTGTSDNRDGSRVFFDHMLTHIAARPAEIHGQRLADLQIDDHHTVEDVGIVLGKAFPRGGYGRGSRVGNIAVLRDGRGASVFCAIDTARPRANLRLRRRLPYLAAGRLHHHRARPRVFPSAVAVNVGWTVHLRQMAGT
jgi:imidazoleglycerol-phosphate dehydratase